ncbi:phenylalanine--tRNA ligase subunit alpha [Pantoea sp. Mhis]|uniref:phenylalanine--tRNA ligase subunit alpha n=1 Tax=Pantoea sp. Mhis TaxID=2576759 RepID=UPI00135CDAB9|nr:phenylalanine--tRNA ligase subunit alpha [Pantoea sp. Mhis]MXP56332.1 phenylalanine--tRNA ligase subunit alpha [Pantoea sp. Mhis]
MSQLVGLVSDAKAAIDEAKDINSLEALRIKFLGKKGHLTLQMKMVHKLPSEERPKIGAIINTAKQQIQNYINSRKYELENTELNARLSKETIDISLPGRRIENGCLHPITRTIDRIETFFIELGFNIVCGPEIEDNYHNFDALNIPKYHPARTKHDTFWFDTNRLLRTQMSSVQIRTMKHQSPPIRIIASGRVYRNDYDQTHSPMFHQMEGLFIDKYINFSNLKWILYDLLNTFFEKNVQIRFRSSYFPFTEPSAEVDILDQNEQWLEVLGCGMVHPTVLHNVGIDSEIYSGFAFGIGIERLTMLRYSINDLRVLFENDLRFLRQFK